MSASAMIGGVFFLVIVIGAIYIFYRAAKKIKNDIQGQRENTNENIEFAPAQMQYIINQAMNKKPKEEIKISNDYRKFLKTAIDSKRLGTPPELKLAPIKPQPIRFDNTSRKKEDAKLKLEYVSGLIISAEHGDKKAIDKLHELNIFWK